MGMEAKGISECAEHACTFWIIAYSSRPVPCTMRETRPQYNGWLQCILEITDVRQSRREADDRRLRYQAPSDIGSAAAVAASMTTGEAVFTL